MKITTVEVRRLFSFGQYENMTIGYTAEVGQDEDPSEVREALTRKIEAEYAERANAILEMRTAEADVNMLTRYTLPNLRQEATELERKIERMVGFLKQHGVDTTIYELPF